MASSNKSGFKIITVGVSIRLFILVIVIFFFQSVDTVFAQSEYGHIVLYRYDYNQNKCSYHFSAKSFGGLSDGEFYLSYDVINDSVFFANNVGQRGLIDLGSSVQFDSSTIEIPSTGYYDARAAIQQHVYLSLARSGEDNRYILFRVNYVELQGKAVGLEYYILETGTIVVQTNIKGNFRINGPRKFTGEGTSWQKERALTGTYTIIFDPIPSYETPSSQSKTLERGGTVVFEGNYEKTPLATIMGSVINANTGDPIGGATVTVDGEQASTDSGGSFSLSVDAGSYTLEVSKQGYQIDTRSVTVDPGETKNILVTLSGVRARLSIDTTPVKGTVTVNGDLWGIAPVSQEVQVATYTVSFGVMTGYTTPADQVAVVTANTITTILGTYVLIPPETGTLSIDTTPVKGTVTVNGDLWGIAPQSRDVEIGTYTVTYGDMTGYTRPNPLSANVAADETERVLGIYIEKLEPEHPNAIFTNSPDEPVVNQIITFDASASSDPDGTIVGYEWDFDDGNTRMGMEITHAYDDAGTYTVTLTITDDDGLTDTTSTIIEVIVQEPPEATFSYHPSDPKEGDTVTFDASESYDSDGAITNYAWLFGDGDSGEGMNVVHVYDEAATYTVTLTVTDNDRLKDTATKPIRIDPEPKTFSWLTTEVVLAIIGVIGTFITAYFGYRAVTARSQKT